MEQQNKEKAVEAVEVNKVVEEKPATVEEMSVDELNSLSAEERRDQMLKALEKRTSLLE